jgi:cytochrome o ubiquinol oxidase operon protein cyoD
MSDIAGHGSAGGERHGADMAPGEEFHGEDIGAGVRGYVVGLVLAGLLTAASFWVLRTQYVWAPAIPIALVVFAIAQMGVHLVFFLHITTGPDNTNNVMALAFGILIVFLVVGGSIWIMYNMNRNMSGTMPPMAPMEMTGPKP